MTASSQWRGHPIYWDTGLWRYTDTGENVGDVDRPCGFCGKGKTPEGHDGCLGTLPEDIVMNACCGHGNDRQAYIQYWDGTDIRGPSAMSVQARMIRKRDLANHRYACMNRPKPGDPWLQLEDGCGHTEKKSDASCTGCKWR